MNSMPLDPRIFEGLIHLLELSVVVGIGVIVYITKKYSSGINQRLEKTLQEQWAQDETRSLSKSSERTTADNLTFKSTDMGDNEHSSGKDSGNRTA